MHEFFALPLEGNVHSAIKLGIITSDTSPTVSPALLYTIYTVYLAVILILVVWQFWL